MKNHEAAKPRGGYLGMMKELKCQKNFFRRSKKEERITGEKAIIKMQNEGEYSISYSRRELELERAREN